MEDYVLLAAQIFAVLFTVLWWTLIIAVAWSAYRTRVARLRECAFRALAGDPPPAVSTVMYLGSRGPAVVRWKDQLRALGYRLSTSDRFDEETVAATADYQKRLGVAADGIAGPRTQHFWWRR